MILCLYKSYKFTLFSAVYTLSDFLILIDFDSSFIFPQNNHVRSMKTRWENRKFRITSSVHPMYLHDCDRRPPNCEFYYTCTCLYIVLCKCGVLLIVGSYIQVSLDLQSISHIVSMESRGRGMYVEGWIWKWSLVEIKWAKDVEFVD